MADIKPDEDDKIIAAAPTAQAYRRAPALEGSDPSNNTKTDQTLRLDGEKDTLYDDGLEIEDDSRTLTGIDGQDDSNPER